MIKPIIADAGIVVAFLDKSDAFHSWTLQQIKTLPIPFLTCEAVIAEACYLLGNLPQGKQKILQLLEKGVLEIAFSLSDEVLQVNSLIEKYKDVPMDLADACLVRMSEIFDNAVIFTLDSDFRIYRKNRRQEIPLIIPPNR